VFAADTPAHLNTYREAYGATKGSVSVDPAKDLPRYPAVEPKDAIATWKVKPGFKLELAANEPLVRDPIAVAFDENGRMFVCEMIDYSEERDRNPHLGRISVLEDRDGDGRYETSRVFADNLPWPNGLIWANGGLYVGATPDIWRFEDRDGDGRAEVREKVFTGFGTGLARLNVQAMFNSFTWGADNRIHVQGGTGNRGLIRSLRRPVLPAV
jgi:putative membrane-bound dehydrogenase-like protein